MKENINRGIIKCIIISSIILSTVVAVIIFIPALIWGIFNDLTLSEICEMYWIYGFKMTIIEAIEEFRGL